MDTEPLKKKMLWIRIGLNADPGPAFYLNATPDPDSKSQPMRIHADSSHEVVFFVVAKIVQFPCSWIRIRITDPDPHPHSRSGSRTAK